LASFSQEKETEQSSPKELLGPWPKTFEGCVPVQRELEKFSLGVS
jgi:hypothetical protein